MPDNTPATILVIDDEESVRDVIREPLEQIGYRVLTSNDGVSGVHRFMQHQKSIELVIVDRTMPRKSGDEAATEIREVRPDVPILMISGYMEKDMPERLTRDGRLVFLKKPFRSLELVAAVRDLLGEAPERETDS